MTAFTNSPSQNADAPTLSALALQIAQSQVGQTEQPKGSNRGPMVDAYLHSVTLPPGYAWCQAFVYWCYNEAAKQLALTNPVIRTAGVYDCWNRTGKELNSDSSGTKMGKQAALIQPGLLQPGNQFILTYGRSAGHTGIIERIASEYDSNGNPVTILHTIEGNSNNDGDREGYAVVRHERKLTDKALQGFIQY